MNMVVVLKIKLSGSTTAGMERANISSTAAVPEMLTTLTLARNANIDAQKHKVYIAKSLNSVGLKNCKVILTKNFGYL